MTRCACQPDLPLYFDGELDLVRAASMKQHLLSCPQCARDLREMQELSALLSIDPAEEFNEQELGRLHGMVDQWVLDAQSQPLPFHWIKALSAMAASVLIIASAWLVQAPAPGTPGPLPIAVAPDWERTAVTLQVEPLPPGLGQSDLADRNLGLTDWFLDNLGEKPNDAQN